MEHRENVTAVRVAYIVMQSIGGIVYGAGGAIMTYASGNGWWVAGGMALTLTASFSFTQRVNS